MPKSIRSKNNGEKAKQNSGAQQDGLYVVELAPGPNQRVVPPHYIYLLDVSGSMSGGRIKQSIALIKKLQPEAPFTIIAFNNDTTIRTYSKPSELYSHSINVGYQTDIQNGLEALVRVLESKMSMQSSGPMFVIGISDGAENRGNALQYIYSKLSEFSCRYNTSKIRVGTISVEADAAADIFNGLVNALSDRKSVV